MFGLGGTEIWVIVGIIAVILAVRRLPTLTEALLKSIRNFKRSLSGQDEIDVTPKPTQDETHAQLQTSDGESSPRP